MASAMNSPPSSPLLHSSLVAPSSSPSPKTISHSISLKLTRKNYILWSQQVEPIIKCHKLFQSPVSPVIPPKFLTIADRDNGVVFAEYQAWEEQDQFLLAWLQSMISGEMLSRVVGCKFAW